jgi:Tat protein translocase TatC
MFGLGIPELIVIFVIALWWFSPKKLCLGSRAGSPSSNGTEEVKETIGAVRAVRADRRRLKADVEETEPGPMRQPGRTHGLTQKGPVGTGNLKVSVLLVHLDSSEADISFPSRHRRWFISASTIQRCSLACPNATAGSRILSLRTFIAQGRPGAAFYRSHGPLGHLKIGFVAGMMLMLPVILYQIWKFISPGLLRHERKYASQFVVFATIFFGIGVLFCFFFLLPFAIPFLVAYKTEHLRPIIKIGDYINFTLMFMIAAGAVFELPLIMIVLGRMGVINANSLAKFRKYAFLGSFVIGGILTPTPDAFNMTIMSIPIYLLYELGILGVRILGRKKDLGSTDLSEI